MSFWTPSRGLYFVKSGALGQDNEKAWAAQLRNERFNPEDGFVVCDRQDQFSTPASGSIAPAMTPSCQRSIFS